MMKKPDHFAQENCVHTDIATMYGMMSEQIFEIAHSSLVIGMEHHVSLPAFFSLF